MSYMLGVDVGGTFTDVTIFDAKNTKIKNHKLPSTPHDPSVAIMDGINEILFTQHGVHEQVSYLAHGTTVATNAMIERKGAKTALIVTKGFKDLFEIARQTRPDLYNLFMEKPDPIIPGDLRYEIEERLFADGSISTPLDKKQINTIVEDLKKKEITSIAVCFLFSFNNPVHEKEVVEEIEKLYPEAYVSASYEIVPEFREYPRLSTTAMNAYLGPVMKRYMENFDNSVKSANIPVNPYITQSNGGVISIQESVKTPIKTAVSGPAAGVVAASYTADMTGYKDLITFDMGGTSADFSLIENGTPKVSMEREIESFPARIPMLDINTYGAGGGSIAWLDEGGALKVGPHSAGAIPGPAAYGKGGTLPTVTDANVVLGRLNPSGILGGNMNIDIEASKKAIRKHICEKTNLTLTEAASGILSIVNSNMTKGVRLISVEKGHSPSDFALLSFGGGGGLHCGSLANELNVSTVIVPPSPGTFSSMGLIVSDIKSDFVRTGLLNSSKENIKLINQYFQSMENEGDNLLEDENIKKENRYFIYSIDMRFKGQNYELPVSVHPEELYSKNIDIITERFHEIHEKTYGYSDKTADIEFVNYRLTACGSLPKITLNKNDKPIKQVINSENSREVFFSEVKDSGYYKTDILQRSDLTYGNKIIGPAIIEQLDSTILILPNQSATVDPYYNLIINTKREVNHDES